jgi:hypothetical protein
MAVTVAWLDSGVAVAGGGGGGHGCVMEVAAVMPHRVAVAAWRGGCGRMA